ncbi:MAG: hypothetical protein AB2728_15100 [Candidatus Thiodiazotropha sp.]
MFNPNKSLKSGLLFYGVVFATGLFYTTLLMAMAGKQYQAGTLRLESISARITIVVADSQGISVAASPDLPNGMFETSLFDDTLLIKQEAQASHGDITVISMGNRGGNRSAVTINGETTLIEGSGVVVAGDTHHPLPSLTITLPAGTSVELIDFRGKADIGNIHAPLYITGGGQVRCGEATRTKLDVGRNARIHIARVSEVLEIKAAGNSRVYLTEGGVSRMQADVEGNSRVRFSGRAKKAALSVTDNGRLFVASVDRRESTSISRNGRLTINNR